MQAQRVLLVVVLTGGALLVALAVVLVLWEGGPTMTTGPAPTAAGESRAAQARSHDGAELGPGAATQGAAQREELAQDPGEALRNAGPSQASVSSRITGRVETARAEPLQGATIELSLVSMAAWRAASDALLTTTSDSRGGFTLNVSPDAWGTLTVTCRGFMPSTIWGVQAGEQVVCVLEPGGRVEGLVLDAESELPIEGARVATRVGTARLSVETGEDGRFSLDGVPPNPLVLSALALGYERGELRTAGSYLGGSYPAGSNPGAPAQAAELRLEPGQALFGVVRDDLSGVPVEAAEVFYTLGDPGVPFLRQPPKGSVRLERKTDAAGRFQFERLGLRDASLRVEATGYAPRELRGAPLIDGSAGLEVRLEPAVTVSGVVRKPDLEPAMGAEVFLATSFETRFTTGADGAFSFGGLAPGDRLQVVAQHPEFAPANTELFRAGELSGPLELVLEVPAAIAGLVIDGSGKPAADTRVHLVMVFGASAPGVMASRASAPAEMAPAGRGTLGSEPAPVQVTDAAGRFSFCGLVAGRFVLLARSQRVLGEPLEVEVVAGETTDVTLTVASAGAISGRVVDSAGQAVAGVRVEAVEQREGSSLAGMGNVTEPRGPDARELVRRLAARFRTTATTDSEGAFVVMGLERDATVRLRFQRPGYAPASLQAVAGATGLLQVLEPLVRFEGRVVDATTRRPIPSFTVEYRNNTSPETRDLPEERRFRGGSTMRGGSDFASADGSFVLDRLTPGSYRLRARSPDHRDGEWVVIVVGREPVTGPQVTLALEPVAVVKGVVLDHRGRPANQVPVYLTGQARDGRAAGAAADERTRPERWVRTESTRSDRLGQYRFRELRPGSYELGVGDPQAPAVGPFPIDVEEGRLVSRELRLPPLAHLEVWVGDQAGKAQERASVRLRTEKGVSGPGTARTDGAGRARFENLLPGSYRLSAYGRDGRSDEITISISGAGSYEQRLYLKEGPRR
ncbi:MAG: carboxypeptidase regulatory-like domain-containing protein [Planctomycetota bacterium]